MTADFCPTCHAPAPDGAAPCPACIRLQEAIRREADEDNGRR